MAMQANSDVVRHSQPRILSRFLRSVRLWRVNNAVYRVYSTDTPFTGVLHSARSFNQCYLSLHFTAISVGRYDLQGILDINTM